MDVVNWLESPAGEAWSRRVNKPICYLLSVKDDLAVIEGRDAVDDFVEFLWVADPGAGLSAADVCA